MYSQKFLNTLPINQAIDSLQVSRHEAQTQKKGLASLDANAAVSARTFFATIN